MKHIGASRSAATCDVASNLREPTVFFNKHIAAHKHLSKKREKVYGKIRNCGNDTFHNFPLGGYSKGERLTNFIQRARYERVPY